MAPNVAVSGLRAANLLSRALGVPAPRPTLRWLISGSDDHSYELRLERAGQMHEVAGVRETAVVAWPFEPLRSRERAALRVRGAATDWSEPLNLEAPLFDPSDWAAKFISPEDERGLPLMERAFDVPSRVVRGRLYVTALGVHETCLNGARVGDSLLAPNWTSYDHRLRYETFDVTDLVQEGENVLRSMLGDGWYRGRLGFGGGRRNIYGDRLALLAQLELELADRSTVVVTTDDTWAAAPGPISRAELYDGEHYDARTERPRVWKPVDVVEVDLRRLVPAADPPIRLIEELAPREKNGAIVDFGQNLVGHLTISADGPAGSTVTARHAELLENGELCTWPLRTAEATDVLTLAGDGVRRWTPRFTFHGFRYAEITSSAGASIGDVRANVIHSSMERIGRFECSHPLVNRFHENVVWSMRGNFLGLPTDCPQRDERLGWTGDIQVFAPTACFLYDVSDLLASWLRDVAAEQREDGRVPNFVPDPQRGVLLGSYPDDAPTAAWGDAAVIVPWVLFERYGDAEILARQWDSMVAWVDLVERIAGPRHLWDSGFQYGDWLDPTAPPDAPEKARTEPALVATAYAARSAGLLAKAAGVLGRGEAAKRYAQLAAAYGDAFRTRFVNEDGTLSSDAPTAYALALRFGLLSGQAQGQAVARLTELVAANDFRIATGFVGTPLVCDALCDGGDVESAYRLLLQTGCPSWLYPVTQGATTIWERWDGILPDGSLNHGQMTSFNHYALGAVADWLHRSVAGLAPGTPGYRHLIVRPLVGTGIDGARASHLTRYGMAEVAWQQDGERFELEVQVPAGTTAEVILTATTESVVVGAGAHRWQR